MEMPYIAAKTQACSRSRNRVNGRLPYAESQVSLLLKTWRVAHNASYTKFQHECNANACKKASTF